MSKGRDYLRLLQRVLGLASAQLPAGQGEEPAQEALLALVKTSEGPEAPDALILTILRRRASDGTRAKYRRLIADTRAHEDSRFDREARQREADPARQMMRREEGESLRRSMNELSLEERDLLERLRDGDSISTIARDLGCGRALVRSRRNRLLRKLRRMMDEPDG